MARNRETTVDDDSIFEIDPLQLDKNWREQPRLVFKYARMQADARRAVTVSKNMLEVTKAELSLKIRKRPEKYGLEKVTEAGLDVVIVNQLEYKQAFDGLLAAQHEVDVISAFLQGLDHRKKALEGSVSLLLAEYHAEPTARGKTKEDVDRVEKQFTRRAGKRQVEEGTDD